MKSLIFASAFALAVASPAYAAPLTVELEGVRSAGGPLYISVQTREQFMQDRGTAGEIVRAPRPGAHRFSYDLPPGEYAVSVWHDDNGNGRFDMHENRMPLDGWALSNREPLRGEPRFEDVRVVHGAAAATVRLSMTYGR
jgi:uncharacterized protein (DUF2141 family)